MLEAHGLEYKASNSDDYLKAEARCAASQYN